MQLCYAARVMRSLGKRVGGGWRSRLQGKEGGCELPARFVPSLGIAQFSTILGRRGLRSAVFAAGFAARGGCEKGVVVNRGGGRGGDTWKWIFIECLRGSGGERREWKLILCRLSVFQWVTGVPLRVSRLESRDPLPLLDWYLHGMKRRSFNIPRWIKRMMNIFFFSLFSSSSLTLNVSRSFPLLLPFFSLINFQLLSYFVYIYLYILIIKWVWKFILNQCIRNREISVFTTRNSSHYPARSPVEWRREKWGLSSWRNRVKGRGVKRIEEKRREKGGLIKKNGARRRGKKQHGQPVGVNRGELKGRVGRGVIFAQPIPATLSTVKTWALTTGDHNRAYLFPAPPLLHLVFSRRRCTEGYLPLLLVHPARPSLHPLAISRILSPKLWIDSQRSRERRRDPWKGESGWRLVLLYWNIEWSTKG